MPLVRLKLGCALGHSVTWTSDYKTEVDMTSSTTLSYQDLMLSNQDFLRRDFNGDENQLYLSMFGAIVSSTEIVPPIEEFDLVQSSRFSVEEMASHPILLRLLQFLIHISRTKHVLEIGAFIGVSAMSMARALPADGTLTTIEKFSEFADICRQNFAQNELADRINLLEGDAMEVVPTLSSQTFDFVFLDGNKEKYTEYFDLVDKLVSPRGLIIVDNMFCCGDTLNDPPVTKKAAGVKNFLDYAHHRRDYSRVLLPIYDGVMLMYKTAV